MVDLIKLTPVKFPPIPGLEKQPSVEVVVLTYEKVSRTHIDWLLDSASSLTDPPGTPAARSLGLDTEFTGPALGLIQLASETRCLLIKVPKPSKNRRVERPRDRNEALDTLLADPLVRKTGCELTKDALLLRANFGHNLRGGVDLTHLYSPSDLTATSHSATGLFTLFSTMYLPSALPLQKDKLTTTSPWVGVELTPVQLSYGVVDAWVSYKVGIHNLTKVGNASVLDFATVDPKVLDILVEQNTASLAVEDMTRKQYESKFSTVTRRRDGSYDVLNTQFRNKLMSRDKIAMHLDSGELHLGTVLWGPHGKTKTVKPDQPLDIKRQILKITVIEQGPTRGADEFLRDVFPKLVLHGTLDTAVIPFFRPIFLGQKAARQTPTKYDLSGQKLNASQTKAVETMLSSQKPVNLIHGPPGTGKTYAITAAVAASVASTKNHNFYVLTCQTNAATRNLAVTLLKRQVTDFIILVSDNFFVEWHEEQYKVIRDHVVQSSETVGTGFSNCVGPRTVVLCSLSQLSNPRISSVLRQRRVTHIVIDEASQISVANLPHVLALYRESLQRLTFVGDPKQLAPFGNEQHPAVQSIFERMPADVMLQEQYRMPYDLGAFISKEVYNGRLTSHKQPRPGCSVALVDVSDGTEKMLGTGINNPREADAVVKIVMTQFLTREFLVITPYNAQKELIANRLRQAIRKLNSEGKTDVKLALADERVHTVDTVQGQEADVIVFSAVRTIQPGFLSNKRRMNVALTRAKDRLVIVARMSLFRTGHGKTALLGTFIREMEKVSPVVNSKQLTTSFKLDFMPKVATGFTLGQLDSSSVAVNSSNVKRGKHWRKNKKRNAKKKNVKKKKETEKRKLPTPEGIAQPTKGQTATSTLTTQQLKRR
ncbi:hypothetical protein HDU85_006428 [Gaertneriomyces sp. JEL0708]|nr:hypothetical protein HDU85_006428 [Gaertneriomyces sp. JEL0708]